MKFLALGKMTIEGVVIECLKDEQSVMLLPVARRLNMVGGHLNPILGAA